MFDLILGSLAPISFAFELLALLLSFYFKHTRIFFIVLNLLLSKILYLYASLYQINLFLSLFLPFVFVLFVLSKKTALILEKSSFIKLGVIFFVGILALFLSKSTNFNASLSEDLFELGFFSPLSDLSAIFFMIELLFLLFWGFLRGELYFVLAFVLLFMQFLFQKSATVSFFEFASLYFALYLLYKSYKTVYFDPVSKLANGKAMKRRLLGLRAYYLGILRFEGLANLERGDKIVVLKKIGKVLRRQKGVQIFHTQEDFILVFEDEGLAKTILKSLKDGFENTSSWLKDKPLQLSVSTALIRGKEDYEESILSLQDAVSKRTTT